MEIGSHFQYFASVNFRGKLIKAELRRIKSYSLKNQKEKWCLGSSFPDCPAINTWKCPFFLCTSKNNLQIEHSHTAVFLKKWHPTKFMGCFRKFRFADLRHLELRGGGCGVRGIQIQLLPRTLCSNQDAFSSYLSRCDTSAAAGLPAGVRGLLTLHFLIALGCDLANWLDLGALLKATRPRYPQVQVGFSLQHSWATTWSRKILNYFHSGP